MVYLGANFCSVFALSNVSSCLGLLEAIRRNTVVVIDHRYNSSYVLMFLLNQHTKKLKEQLEKKHCPQVNL